MRTALLILATGSMMTAVPSGMAAPFVGSIRAESGPPGATTELLYTVGTNFMRVEKTATNFPYAVDVVNSHSGQITLIRPWNDTFVRFTPGKRTAFIPPPHAHHPGEGGRRFRMPRPPMGIGPTNFPEMPAAPGGLPPGIGPTNMASMPGGPGMPIPPGGLPPGIGPQTQAGNTPPTLAGSAMPEMPKPPGGLPPGIGPQTGTRTMPTGPAMSAMPAVPAMAMMPPPGGIHLQLKALGGKTILLNYPCRRYEINSQGQVMEIWATDQLLPFQVYLSHEQHQLGPPILEEQWGRLLAAKKLFPLKAVLRLAGGMERYRFEVRSITPHKLTKKELAGFQPPAGYVEMQPKPF